MPVFVNGDIDCAAKALKALETKRRRRRDDRPRGAGPALDLPRSARGTRRKSRSAPASLAEVRVIMLSHLEALYSFYGEIKGVRVARKHLGWYCRLHPEVGHLPARAVDDGMREGAVRAHARIPVRTDRQQCPRGLNDKDGEVGDQLAMIAKHRALTSRRPFTVTVPLNGHCPRHSAARPHRTGPQHLFRQPEWPSPGPPVRSRDARGRIAAVPGGHGLRGWQPEPRGDDPRHQSRHPAQETARVRAGLLSRWRGRRPAGVALASPTRPAWSNSRASCTRLGFELISTGGTAARLQRPGLPVTEVAELTGFPRSWTGASRRCTRKCTAPCSAGPARTTR